MKTIPPEAYFVLAIIVLLALVHFILKEDRKLYNQNEDEDNEQSHNEPLW